MNSKPIVIVPGEPNSIFLEIFFKSFKYKYNSPLILIVSKDLLIQQMNELGFNYKINLIDKKYQNFEKLNNSMINIIDVNYIFQNTFEKISNKSNNYFG